MADIASRKHDHLDLSISGDVGFRKTHLLECVELLHDALPEMRLADIDTSVELFGKKLRAPIIIAAMTGGNDRAKAINFELASIAEECGFGFGMGSQRAMLVNPDVKDTYSVRSVAPTALVFGNLGGVQASKLEMVEVADLAHSVGADALCIHLNPAMELVQPEGDRDFRGILGVLGRISGELRLPVIAKETGCGISASVAKRLHNCGIKHVDVSGAGGTSWVAVESARLPEQANNAGQAFRDWGIPTAPSVAYCCQAGFETIIATGGVTSGLDVAKAVALGAHAAGIARPVLQAFDNGGRQGALQHLRRIEGELRMAMFLTGSRTLTALRTVERRIMSPLSQWILPV